MNTMVSRTLSVHKEHELLLKLETAGLDEELAQKVIDSKSNDLAAKVVRMIQNVGFESSTSQKRAREIMGRNFFGIEETIKYFGVNPSKQELTSLAKVPFTEGMLRVFAGTHVLVAVFPMSIVDICDKVERTLFFNHEDPWYYKESFAKERGMIGWHLVCKTLVPESTSKTWDEQQVLLGRGEEATSARVMVYTIIGHYFATGERLFKGLLVARTKSLVSNGDHVSIGYFDHRGLTIDGWCEDDRNSSLGISSALKSSC